MEVQLSTCVSISSSLGTALFGQTLQGTFPCGAGHVWWKSTFEPVYLSVGDSLCTALSEQTSQGVFPHGAEHVLV